MNGTCVAVGLLLVTLQAFAPATAAGVPGAGHLAGRVLLAVVGLGGCGTMWVRRRWPLRLTVLLLGLDLVSPEVAGWPLQVTLFTSAVHRRVKAVLPVLAACVLVAILQGTHAPSGALPRVAWMAGQGSFPLAVAGTGMCLRARRQFRSSRAERDRSAMAQQVRVMERARIAREMHDVLAHRISLVSLHAGALQVRSGASDPDVAVAAETIRENAHLALQELRQVIGLLRDTDPDRSLVPQPPQPSLTDLDQLIEDSRQAGLDVDYQLDVSDPAGAPSTAGRTVYRVVQEAVTNARKHAPGARVRVRVQGAAGTGLVVEVDNGAVRDRQARIPGSGVGLIGLAERVELAGGRLHHGGTSDGGFAVHATLPWSR